MLKRMRRKGTSSAMLVAMQSGPTIMKISMEDPQKITCIYVKLYVSVSVCVYHWDFRRTPNQRLTEITAHRCSLQRRSQQLNYGTNPSS